MSAAALATLRAAIANAKETHSGDEHTGFRSALDAADSAASSTLAKTSATSLKGAGNAERQMLADARSKNPIGTVKGNPLKNPALDGGGRKYDTNPRAKVPDATSGSGIIRNSPGHIPKVTNKKPPAYRGPNLNV